MDEEKASMPTAADLKEQEEGPDSPDPKEQDYFVLETQGDPKPATRQDEKIACYVWVLTLTAVLGGFLFGYDTGIISGAMVFIKDQFLLSIMWQQLIVSITIATAAIFASLAGWASNWLGRRVVIIVSAATFAIGSFALPLANGKVTLMIGRAIQGIGIGLASATVPIYVSECAPLSRRGFLVTCFNMSVVIGLFIAAVIAGLFSQDYQHGWRYMLGLAAVPAVIQFIAFFFLPETPRWLIQSGRNAQARQVLTRMRDSSDAQIDQEFEQIKSTVSAETRKDKSFVLLEMLRYGPVRRALFIGCGLSFFGQFAGINTVMYYGATIFKMAGIQNLATSVWLTVIPSAANILGNIAGLYLVDKVGRKPLVLASIIGVIVSLFWLGLGFFLSHQASAIVSVTESLNVTSDCSTSIDCNGCMAEPNCGLCYAEDDVGIHNASCVPLTFNNSDISAAWGRCSELPLTPILRIAHDYCPTKHAWMTLSGMIIYLVSFSSGLGPMPWTINAEIYPMWARSAGTALSTLTVWAANFFVSITFLSLTQLITIHGTFWMYTGFSMIGLLFFIFLLPETKGKTLEEVETLFKQPWCCNSGRRSPPSDNKEYNAVPQDEKQEQY